MVRAPQNRPPRSRRQAKMRVKALLKIAKEKARNNMYAHTTDLTQKRWGELLKDGTKRIEVRAWSRNVLLSRLSQDNDPKIGRYNWSHEGQNSLAFMYPHVDEPTGWGTASSFDELKANLTKLRQYDQCFSTKEIPPGTEEKLRGGQAEFEDFVKTKLANKALAWFRVRPLYLGDKKKKKKRHPKPPKPSSQD